MIVEQEVTTYLDLLLKIKSIINEKNNNLLEENNISVEMSNLLIRIDEHFRVLTIDAFSAGLSDDTWKNKKDNTYNFFRSNFQKIMNILNAYKTIEGVSLKEVDNIIIYFRQFMAIIMKDLKEDDGKILNKEITNFTDHSLEKVLIFYIKYFGSYFSTKLEGEKIKYGLSNLIGACKYDWRSFCDLSDMILNKIYEFVKNNGKLMRNNEEYKKNPNVKNLINVLKDCLQELITSGIKFLNFDSLQFSKIEALDMNYKLKATLSSLYSSLIVTGDLTQDDLKLLRGFTLVDSLNMEGLDFLSNVQEDLRPLRQRELLLSNKYLYYQSMSNTLKLENECLRKEIERVIHPSFTEKMCLIL